MAGTKANPQGEEAKANVQQPEDVVAVSKDEYDKVVDSYNKLVKAFNKLLKEYNDLHIQALLSESQE